MHFCIMYIHSDILESQQSDMVEDTIKLLCMEPQCVQFLFVNNDK